MSDALRAELFKQRTTRTSLGLFAAMLGLVLLAVLLHGLGLAAGNFDSASGQLTTLFGWGEVFGTIFAALLGAMSITGEIRHGTIRPTLLVTPDRRRVVAAKAWASLLIGTGFGFASSAVAAGVGTAALGARQIDVRLDVGDYASLIAGGAVAAGLWAAIGVGLGAIVRAQAPALVGVTVWLLLIENLFVGDIAGAGAGRYLPGAAGKAISGLDPDTLLAPWLGLVVLILYAAAAAIAGRLAITRRDID